MDVDLIFKIAAVGILVAVLIRVTPEGRTYTVEDLP